ncbi:MAG: tyrosine-type recombinase/integrase [Sulfuricaulis sp.]
MTFQEALVSLFADMRLRNYSPATVHHYGDQLKRFEEWLSEELTRDLRRVTKNDIDLYQRYVRSEPIGIETQALRLRAVKRLFDHLTASGQLLLHPAEHIIEIRRRDRIPKAVLSVKQVTQLLAAPNTTTALGIRDRALLEVMYSTAIRVGEMEAVFVSDVNLAEQTLHIRRGKGDKERIVPLGATAAQWVKRYLDDVRPGLVKTRPYERALFLVCAGRSLKQTQVREILKKYRRQCHLRKAVTPHALRHACATHLLLAGANIRVIQQLLGHAKLDSTAIYTRIVPIDIKAMHETYHPGETSHATE